MIFASNVSVFIKFFLKESRKLMFRCSYSIQNNTGWYCRVNFSPWRFDHLLFTIKKKHVPLSKFQMIPYSIFSALLYALDECHSNMLLRYDRKTNLLHSLTVGVLLSSRYSGTLLFFSDKLKNELFPVCCSKMRLKVK